MMGKTPNKWLMFAVVYFCAVTVSFAQLKIPPVMGLVAEGLNISMSQAGWLMSLFTLAGIILAIPGGLVMAKVGAKKLLILQMICLIIGNFLGAVAGNYVLMLIARAIEGFGFAMIILTSIYIINACFAGSKTGGTAMGLLNTFAPLGSFVTMNAGLPVAAALGYRGLWIIVGILAIVCLLLVIFVLKVPEPEAQTAGPAGDNARPSLTEAFKNTRIWILAFTMGILAFMAFVPLTTYPLWFQGFYGVEPQTANFYSSLNGLMGIPLCILIGILVDKTQRPVLILLIGMILMLVCAFTFDILSGPATYAGHALLSSLASGLGMTTVFYLAPRLAKQPQNIGYSISIVNQIYFIGVFLSTPVILSIIESSGFSAAKWFMVVITIISVVLAAIQKAMSGKAPVPLK